MRNLKYKDYDELIRKLYKETNKNIKKTAEKFCEQVGEENPEKVRRGLSVYISRNIDLGRSATLIEHSDHFRQALKKKIKKKKYYLITCAQNGTPVFTEFLENMKAYAEFLKAELIVIPSRYKNPTSVFTDRDHDRWDDDVMPYLSARRHDIHPHLTILGDIKVQPTTSNPLGGKELITGMSSCIIGHPRVHLKSVPRLPDYMPKVMMTTGAVTVPNYTDSNAGKIGHAHHTFGFVIVEIKDNQVFYPRQVTATDSGSFTDLCYKVSKGRVSKVKRIEALSMGDVHLGQHDAEVLAVTEEKLIKKFKPRHVILHDIMDGYSVNHHAVRDPIYQFLAEKYGKNDVNAELEMVMHFLGQWKKYNLVISNGNHDNWLDQYIRRMDWRKDVKNAQIYNKMHGLLLEEKAPKGLLAYLIEERFGDKITCLGVSDSYRVMDWELGFHGHLGVNGARGSNNTFKKLSTKIIKAHDHTPTRIDGCISNGTTTKLSMGYNTGLTTWMHGHTIVHKDSKAQQLLFIRGDFTTLF